MRGATASGHTASGPTLRGAGIGARRAVGGPAHRTRGFTLVELLVVVAIIGMASAGVMTSLRSAQDAALEREAVRLAALLEGARARARASGQTIRWWPTETGFHFDMPDPIDDPLPTHWLGSQVQVDPPVVLHLGPEPLIAAQSVTLHDPGAPGTRWRIGTNGWQPFEAVALPTP